MCGLTGFARHPQGANLDAAVHVFNELMLRMAHRGRHATGAAVIDPQQRRIWKRAAPVNVVAKSEPWNAFLGSLRDDTTMMLGHVRWGTHGAANAANDDAAHPFQEGKIIGAHNGIVTNWKEVGEKFDRDDLINDSQAPFVALDNMKDAVKALDLLDGYWALTWAKGGSLFFARTNDAPLACAYVPEMMTLFWHSERETLKRTLQELNVGPFELWEPNSNTLYRYVPSQFSRTSTNVEKKDAPFRGRNMANGKRMTNSARPSISADVTTQSTAVTRWRDKGWDATNARELPPTHARPNASTRDKGGTSTVYTLRELNERMDELEADLKGRIEVLEAENEHMRDLLAAHDLLDVFEDEDPDRTPPGGGGKSGVVELPEPLSPDRAAKVKCVKCGRSAALGTAYDMGKGEVIHDACILADAPVVRPRRVDEPLAPLT